METIKEKNYAETINTVVKPYLDGIKTEGSFKGYDGADLKYCSYAAKDARQTLVMLHGFTESTEKYAELIYYFVNSGSNVFIYDQRGHGYSFRENDDYTVTHIDSFDEYVKDFECFMENKVPKDLPLCLFAHSMGGAVAALYLEKHPEAFGKAVLSSPMIAPARGGVPLFAAKAICRVFIAFGKAKDRIFLSSEYPGEEKFEDSCTTSEARFSRYERFKRVNPTHQNYSPSYRWTLESLKVTAKILAKGAPEKIATKVLICSAAGDTTVLNPEQEKLAARIPDCRIERYDSKHEIYNSPDDVIEKYVGDLLDFMYS